MLIIGSHVSFGNEQLLGATKEALSYGANAFMFYTGAPTNTIRKEIDPLLLEEAYKLMEGQIKVEHIICHAPYIVNLANASDPEKYNFSIQFLNKEINRCEQMNIRYLVLHPGSAVGIAKETGIENIANALNQMITKDTKTMILLETMAGKGSEVGTSIDEIKTILDKVTLKDKIGVCIDTCHLHDAGYDLEAFDSYLEEFEEKIGLEKIRCVHVNDSKNELGSHKDRHANIGYGLIGFTTLNKIIYHEKLKDVPKILETPYIGNFDEDKERLYPPYKFEIQMIEKQAFNSNLMEDIRSFYK